MKRVRLPARAVLLDWDGTILNSFEADSRAFLAMFHALGINWGMAELERHYSPNWHFVYRAAGVRRSMWDTADRLWREAYAKESPKLLPGARNAIRKLSRRVILGIVSSGSRARVRRQLRHFKLAAYFSACVCAEDAAPRKPNPAPLKVALQRLKLRPPDCVYVGDTPEDIEMARRARVRAIGVRGPFPTAAKVVAAKPDLMLDSIAELPEWIDGLG